MALENDYTSVNYNSYVIDIDEMNSLVAKLNGFYDISKWTSILDLQIKENVILASIADLNSFDFEGGLNNSVISPFNMKWPRNGTYYQNGIAIQNSEIPIFVLDYISVRALERLANVQNGAFDSSTVKRQKLGDLEQEFFDPNSRKSLKNTLKKNPSFEIIRAYVSQLSGAMRFVSRA